MKRRIFALALAGTLLGSMAALAADKPDFSGQWKLNTDKSDFGMMPKPEKADYTITHKDPELGVASKVVSPMGDMSNESKYFTDGREFTNTIRGMEVKGTAKWDGAVLVLNEKLSMQGTEISVTQKWSLSEDGKTLTQEIAISTPQGEMTQKAVLDKV